MTPRWRWWLFCAALETERRTDWEWARRLWAWCVLPAWMATDEEIAEATTGTVEREPW